MTGWRQSSLCAGNGDCIQVRPSRNRRMVWLRRVVDGASWWDKPVSRAEWNAFVAGIKNGDFDDLEATP